MQTQIHICTNTNTIFYNYKFVQIHIQEWGARSGSLSALQFLIWTPVQGAQPPWNKACDVIEHCQLCINAFVCAQSLQQGFCCHFFVPHLCFFIYLFFVIVFDCVLFPLYWFSYQHFCPSKGLHHKEKCTLTDVILLWNIIIWSQSSLNYHLCIFVPSVFFPIALSVFVSPLYLS